MWLSAPRFSCKPKIAPVLVAGYLLALFVALPLSFGWYDAALLAIPRNTPIVTIVGAALAQLLFFYVEVLCIAVVVARSGRGPIQRILGTVLPLATALFWVTSYLSLSLFGHFISLRTLGALVTLDTTLSHHISSTDTRYLVGLTVVAVLVGVGVRTISSHSFAFPDPSRLRKRLALATLALTLSVIPNLELTRRGSFGDVLRRFLSPEFFVASDLYQFAEEVTDRDSASFASMPTPIEWAKLDTNSKSTRPDVYIIVVEGLRWDVLSPRNDPQVVVPNLYALARKSWVYSRTYAGAPDTGYALETIVTGTYPYHGVLRHTSEAWSVESFPHLYDLLHQLGYRTGFFSATNWRSTARLMRRPSLDMYYDPSHIGASLPEISSSASLPFPEILMGLQFMERSSLVEFQGFDRSSVEHLLAWLHEGPDSAPNLGLLYFVSSHYPWYLSDDTPRLYPTKLKELPQVFGASGRDLLQYEPALHYKNALHQTDTMLGEVLQQLEARRERRPSIIVIVGDHGDALGEHSQISHSTSLYDEQVRVPLIINDGTMVNVSADSRPTSQVDIAPTILEMIRAPRFPGHQGTSLDPTSKIKKPEPRKLFLTIQGLAAIDGVVEWPFKAIIDAPTEQVSLFNLEEDPEEARDLSEVLPEETARMARDIKEFQNLQRSYYSLPLPERANIAPARFD